MKVKINPNTKEIEAEIDSQHDIQLLKQLIKENNFIKQPEPILRESPVPKQDILTLEQPEPILTEAPQPKEDIFTEPHITKEQSKPEHSIQRQGNSEQLRTAQAQPTVEPKIPYFARTPILTQLPKLIMVKDIYKEIFKKDAPHNMVRKDPRGYSQAKDIIKALVIQGRLKKIRKKHKTYINTESAVPTEIREEVHHEPERPVLNGKMEKLTEPTKPTKQTKGKKHPTSQWQPFSAGWFEDTILPKLPYKFGQNDAFKAIFHYSCTGKYDDATKSKYMRVYFPLNKLAKQGKLIKTKLKTGQVMFTKKSERPYTPDTEEPKLVWSDIPIIKQTELLDIMQNYQSITAPVFLNRISKLNKPIVENEASVIMNFLIENVSQLSKLVNRKLRVTGFGDWKALEIFGKE